MTAATPLPVSPRSAPASVSARARCAREIFPPRRPPRAPAHPADATISKRQKTVQRAYGGSVCGVCVKQRITRAFLIEEATIVKRVLKAKAVASKK